MWTELKKDKMVVLYFPDYSKTRLPSKTYLMNVTLIFRCELFIIGYKHVITQQYH